MKAISRKEAVIKQQNTLWSKMLYHKWIYLLMLPGIIWFIMFRYVPMVGVGVAFREFSFRNPFFGGDFVGLDNFRVIFSDPRFINALRNTGIISVGRILFEFPVPIILALLFNELRGRKHKRIMQTAFTFPHFISWVVASGIIINLLQDAGAVNQLFLVFGGDRQYWLTDSSAFRPLLHITSNWKGMGWGTIIYLATISGIDSEQYEAALVDGADRFQRCIYITLPALYPVMGILLILSIANLMNAGFDQVFNLYNAAVYDVGDIIDTFIFRRTFMLGESFSVSTAFGLFKSVIGAILLITANLVIKKFNDGRGVF